MQVTLETTSGLERKMRVIIPADQLKTGIEARLQEVKRKARINGFRPGKIPLREVKRRFGEGILREVSSEIMQDSLNQAYVQESVTPVGMPQIEDVVLAEGQDLEYTAIFEILPDIQPNDFSLINVEKPIVQVNDQDIDQMVEQLRQQRVEYSEVDRAAKVDDRVNIDYEGFVNGKPLDGENLSGSKNMNIVVGSNSMIPGFEDNLIGCQAGEHKDIELQFPENYHNESIASQPVEFKVDINSVSEPVLPELDDEFFELFGITEGGNTAFRDEVRQNMNRELEVVVQRRIKSQVIDGLIASNELEIPQSLVAAETERMRHEAMHMLGRHNHDDIDSPGLPAEMFVEAAVKRVKSGLIFNAIVEDLSVQADKNRVRTAIMEIARTYEDPQEVVSYYYSNEEQLKEVENRVIEDQVIDQILEEANVSEILMSYEEAVKPVENNKKSGSSTD
ncbi:MAG: trigger factor [Gammaproteobacteria bacterium]|nr:trigger factor [Gammaproteobacteria bacterium]